MRQKTSTRRFFTRQSTVNAAKLFQLFIEKGVVTIIAIINNAIYKGTRITLVLRIPVYQSLEFFNL